MILLVFFLLGSVIGLSCRLYVVYRDLYRAERKIRELLERYEP